MARPSTEEIVDSLHEMFPAANVELDSPLGELDIDSMDLLEWLYTLVEVHGLEMDEGRLQEVDESMTLRELYDSVFEA
jgi:acyl carrier protein